MKRFLIAVTTLILILTVLNCVLACPAMAATASVSPAYAAPVFDWTPVLIIVIAASTSLLGLLIGHLWKAFVQPWLEDRNLIAVAQRIVYAVEALLGRYCGEDKWRLALDKMQQCGFNVNSDRVVDALKAAWKELDLKQLMAGEKGDRLVVQLDADSTELRSDEATFAGCDKPVPELVKDGLDTAELQTEELTFGTPFVGVQCE